MKDVYSWVPWFQELAEKIASNDNSYLIEKSKKVNWNKENPALLNYGDNHIDPFSFFYFLAQYNRKNSIENIYGSIHEIFELESTLPNPGLGEKFTFPTPPAHATALFHDGRNFFPSLLWDFFRKSVSDFKSIGNKEFIDVLKIPMVGVSKITQCLFLIRPHIFIPADKTIPMIFKDTIGRLAAENGWAEYLDLIEKLKQICPGSRMYEIARALYLLKYRFSNRKPNFFSVTTSILYGRGALWHRDFSENGTVHVESFKNREKLIHTIIDVKLGDIILARDGIIEAYGLGLVEENGYASSDVNTEDALHVVWINRSRVKEKLSEKYQLENFTKDGPGIATGAYDAFRRIEAYKSTFDLIEEYTDGYQDEDEDENRKDDSNDNGGRKVSIISLNRSCP